MSPQEKDGDSQKSIEKAKSSYQFYAKKIKSLQDVINRDFESLKVDDLKDKLALLERYIRNFEDKAIDLDALGIDAPENIEEDESRNEALVSFITRRIAVLEKTPNEPNLTKQDEPKIENDAPKAKAVIKNTWGTFDGSLVNWQSFKNKFNTGVVSNKDYDEALQYELLCEACQVQEVLALITSRTDNIHTAWKKLNTFYGDKYAQINAAMNTIQAHKTIAIASAKTLRNFLNRMTCQVTTIKQALPGEYDALFIPNVAEKLDAETKRSWDRQRMVMALSWEKAGDANTRDISDFLPKWDDFETFIEDEIKVYAMHEAQAIIKGDEQASSSQSVSVQNLRFSPTASYSKKTTCNLCMESHSTHRCEAFLRHDFEGRWKIICQNGLCIRCFDISHAGPCQKSSCNAHCPTCYHNGQIYVYHNSKLCPVKHGRHPGEEGYSQQ